MGQNDKNPNIGEGQEQDFREEAKRLAKLPARLRKEALAVHWRIADAPNLSKVTRDYARNVAETLEVMVKDILKKTK